MRNYARYWWQNTHFIHKLVVSAEGSSPVQFNVEISSGVVYSGTTTDSSPVTVNFPTSLLVNSASYTYRSNGVHVYTTGYGSISVLVINFRTSSVGEYLAYPCQDVGSAPYEYYIVSTLTYGRQSEFLLVGCDDQHHNHYHSHSNCQHSSRCPELIFRFCILFKCEMQPSNYSSSNANSAYWKIFCRFNWIKNCV